MHLHLLPLSVSDIACRGVVSNWTNISFSSAVLLGRTEPANCSESASHRQQEDIIIDRMIWHQERVIKELSRDWAR